MPSISLSARERRNPPPRRKSCAACIKAKRRCDAAAPCFRCQQRRIPCTYASSSAREPSTSSLDLQQPLDWTVDLADETSSSSTSDVQFPSAVQDELLDLSLLNDAVNGDPFGSSMLMAPMTRELEVTSEIFKTRLQYAVDILKGAPTSMVVETQTPWCHPLLYKNGMPKSMQDAFSSCALYMAKNRVNAPIIFRSIDARVRELIESPTPTTLLESMAHTQALCLYQIIRLFDGDVAARRSAELLIPSLENSALQLLNYVRFDDNLSTLPDLPLYPIQPAKDVWDDWILQESARRTALVTFYFLQTYRFMVGYVGLQCDGKMGLCHSWTLSAQLWNAKTAVEFTQACKARQYFVVTNGQFAEVLQHAKAEDVDMFGRIWISSLLGIEETEGWFAARGGTLQSVMV